MTTLKVKLDPGAFEPERAHKADAGYDLRSPVDAVLYPKSSVVIDTGVHVEIPKYMAGFLKSKSGLNVKHNIVGEGVIDSEYTGSICVKLYNLGDKFYRINAGDKITQLVILPVYIPDVELVSALEETERGDNGFGSTGK